MAVALDHLGGDGRGREAEPLADFVFDVGAEMRAGADRAGNFPHGHFARGGREALGVAAIFGEPVRDFQSKRDRLGVNAVRAPDFGRVLEFPRALFEHLVEMRDAFFDQLRSVANEQRLRRVHDVVRCEAVVQPARRLGIADGFLHGDGERDHVVPDLRFDLVDARHVDARAFAELRGGLARHGARFGERFRGGQLDLEPLLEFIFFAPDAAHLQTRVPCDQIRLPEFRLMAGKLPAPSYPKRGRTNPVCWMGSIESRKVAGRSVLRPYWRILRRGVSSWRRPPFMKGSTFSRFSAANHLDTLMCLGFRPFAVSRSALTFPLHKLHVAPRLRSAEVEDSAVKWHRQSCLCSYRF